MPFGSTQPDAGALAARRPRRAAPRARRLSSSSSACVIDASSVTSAGLAPCRVAVAAQQRRERRAAQRSRNRSFSARGVELAARQHRARRRRRARGTAAAPCTPTAACAARRAARPASGGSWSRGTRIAAATTCPRSGSSMPTTWATRPVTVGDRGLDLARRHVGAGGLDHVAAAAGEVEEAVGVDVEEVAGAVPAVGA